MATQQQHATAVLAKLNTSLSPKGAYDFDKVPTPRPDEYADFEVSRRFGGTAREDGFIGTTSWRITVRYVAKTIANVRLMQSKVVSGIEYSNLVVAGEKTTPVLFETSEPIGPSDDGYFTGFDSFTYVL